MTTFQEKGQTCDAFGTLFKAKINTVDAYNGRVGYHPKFYKEHLYALLAKEGIMDIATMDHDKKSDLVRKATASACVEFLVCMFICVADDNQFKGLNQALDNEHLMNKGAYSSIMVEALKLLKNYVVPGDMQQQQWRQQ